MKLTLSPIEGGEPVASVLTGAGGAYKFENLLTGTGVALILFFSSVLVFTSVLVILL